MSTDLTFQTVATIGAAIWAATLVAPVGALAQGATAVRPDACTVTATGTDFTPIRNLAPGENARNETCEG